MEDFMAYAEKYKGYWYVRYKDESGRWRRKACGKKVTRNEADYLAREHSARELNYHHKAPSGCVATDLIKAMEEYKKDEVPRGILSTTKEESSVRRERATVDNFIKFVKSNGLSKFAGLR